MNELRQELLAEAQSGDPTRLRKVITRLFDKAERGDVAAAKIILDRTLGRARQEIHLDLDEDVFDKSETFL